MDCWETPFSRRTGEPGPGGGAELEVKMPWWWVWWPRGPLFASLSPHPCPSGEALLRAKFSQGTPGNLIRTAFSNAGGVMRRKEAPPGLPWPPQLVAKVIRHSLLAQCSRLSPPLSLPIILTSSCWFGLCGFSPSALTGTAGHGLENEGREGVPHSGLPVE